MNLSDLQSECGRLLNDPTNSRWSPAVLTSRINIAQQIIQGYSNAIKTRESVTVISGTGSYTINASTMDIIRIYKVYADGTAFPLRGINREEIDFLYPDWNNWLPGDPICFIYDATSQQVVLAPIPDANINLLSIYESRRPADLVNSTDIPFDSNNQMTPYHIAICYWVVAQCWMDDGTPESLGKAKFNRSGNMMSPGEFEKNLGRIMAEFDLAEAVPARVLWRPSGGRVGYLYNPSKSSPFLY